MAKPECRWESPKEWSEWSQWLAAGVHARNRWRLPVLLGGILFARGRRTVTTWLRAAGTYRPASGMIRVVLIREDRGWLALFCTDPGASVQEILEAFADRATIEQDFHDVKEVWGAGQQQVRNIWTNVAVYQLNLWMHTLVELWAWNRAHDQLCDRSDSPWDDADRRPSHANRRKALREQIMHNELSTIIPPRLCRFARTHGVRHRDGTLALEDLLVALADALWKGRCPELEGRVVQRMATMISVEPWQVFFEFDQLAERLAVDGQERLAWQQRF